MTFKDIFKSSFLDKVDSFAPLDFCIAMILAFAIGVFIWYIYKSTFKGVMYSSGFATSLLIMTLITTLIIIAVTSNVVLSLGMVGALSIVRFRTAIKDPLDIAFLFWSIAVGIVLGAGLIPLAILGSLFIGIVMLVAVSNKPQSLPYILVISCSNDQLNAEERVMAIISERTYKNSLKSKMVSAKMIEMTIEIRLRDSETKFINEIALIPGIGNVTMVSYSGEYMS